MKKAIVVGAGVAGLAAARELRANGWEPVVLEAQARCGGRILSVRDPLSPVPLELGAEFVHGTNPALWNVLRESNATVVEQQGEHVGGSDWEETGRVFEQMVRAPEQSFASFIAGVDATEGVKRAATGYVEGFNAALKEDVSVEWLNLEGKGEGDEDRNFRIINGYDSVPNYLARGLDIRYSTPVRRIRRIGNEVVAETDAGDFRADKAIVAVPLPVLFEGVLQIEPKPEILRRAEAALATGHAIRITFRFARAVWEEHPSLSFIHGDAPFPVWWTPYPVVAPVITGWAAGPKALALREQNEANRIALALKSLKTVMGADPGEPLASYCNDWTADPWARGAYSYVRVNGMAVQRELARPVDNWLCFAGEAAAPDGQVGTVHGAIASGVAAARVTIP
jgi:monoamine oxidase